MPYSARAVYVELSRTLRYEGVAALFRGNWAQVVRVYPYSGSEWRAALPGARGACVTVADCRRRSPARVL